MPEMNDDMERAGRRLGELADGPAREAADAIAEAFERAGARIDTALEASARSGEASFGRLTDSILRDLARLAAESLIERPIRQALDTAISSLPFFGARAEGGPVTAGGAYLVGEHGPELFTPGQTGQVSATRPAHGPAPIVVNLSLPSAGPAAELPSEVQIGRAVRRALERGRRYS